MDAFFEDSPTPSKSPDLLRYYPESDNLKIVQKFLDVETDFHGGDRYNRGLLVVAARFFHGEIVDLMSAQA